MNSIKAFSEWPVRWGEKRGQDKVSEDQKSNCFKMKEAVIYTKAAEKSHPLWQLRINKMSSITWRKRALMEKKSGHSQSGKRTSYSSDGFTINYFLSVQTNNFMHVKKRWTSTDKK